MSHSPINGTTWLAKQNLSYAYQVEVCKIPFGTNALGPS